MRAACSGLADTVPLNQVIMARNEFRLETFVSPAAANAHRWAAQKQYD
jgi:hypothetical protein